MTAPVGDVISATACGRNGNRRLRVAEARSQLADIVELDLVGDEAQAAGLAEEVDAAAEDEHLAVLGQRGHPPRVIGEQDSIEPAHAVTDREVVVPARTLLHSAHLALDQQSRERAQLAPDLVGELGDGVGALGLFGPDHPPIWDIFLAGLMNPG